MLLLLAEPATMQSLRTHLQQLGMVVDAVFDLAAARTAFFGAGGHDCLVVAPDVRPGLAVKVFESLRSVDPELAMASFGPMVGDEDRPARQARLASFHPASRAGTGALVRFLRTMQLR